MLKCMCDLCGGEIGNLGSASVADGTYKNKQVTVGLGGQSIFIGDVCSTCFGRLKDFLNLPKDE